MTVAVSRWLPFSRKMFPTPDALRLFGKTMSASKSLIVLCFVALYFVSSSYGLRQAEKRGIRRPLSPVTPQRGRSGPKIQAASSSSVSYFSDRDGYSSGGSYSEDSYGGSSYSGGGYGGGYDDGGEVKPLAALVAPLAALALLGAAAAVATSPVLLTIAVLSSGRKRRDLESINGVESNPELSKKIHELEVLEKYMAKIPQEQQQQEKLMATYLSCSGYVEKDNTCMERIVCEYSVAPSKMEELEKDVISIVLYNIMSNKFVSKDFKERLRGAAQHGRKLGTCSAFVCSKLN